MEEKREQVKAIAECLLEKETITNVDVTNLIGARPHSAGKEYEEYANAGWIDENKSEASAEEGLGATETELETQDDSSTGSGPLTPGFAAKP